METARREPPLFVEYEAFPSEGRWPSEREGRMRANLPPAPRSRAIAANSPLIRLRAGPQTPSVSALKTASPAVALRHAPAGAAPRGKASRCAHPLAPSARGLRPQAVGERTVRLPEIFRAMARFSPSAPSGHRSPPGASATSPVSGESVSQREVFRHADLPPRGKASARSHRSFSIRSRCL